MSPLSFRTRILLLILAVGLVPLGLLGLWITRTVPASGERLLRGRLEDALETTVNNVSTRWVRQRSEILFLAEAAATYADVLRGEFRPEAEPPPDLLEVFSALDPAVAAATVKDASDRQVWSLDRRSLSGSGGLGTGPLASDGLAPALTLKF